MNRPFSALMLMVDFLAVPAFAWVNGNGTRCAVVIESLASTCDESRRSMGLSEQDKVIATYASTDTGTWAITLTTPSAHTCLVESGQR